MLGYFSLCWIGLFWCVLGFFLGRLRCVVLCCFRSGLVGLRWFGLVYIVMGCVKVC